MSTYDRARFERLYDEDIDPWRFRDSAYESHKYNATMDALPSARFSKCLELGCSIGVLTKMLAARCNSIVAVDTSATALSEAKKSCAGLPIDFRQAHLPEGDFGRGFDLVLASEVLYYFDRQNLMQLARKLRELVTPGAICVSVHWTGVTDYPLTADEAVELFSKEASLCALDQICTSRYRLDVWKFPDLLTGRHRPR